MKYIDSMDSNTSASTLVSRRKKFLFHGRANEEVEGNRGKDEGSANSINNRRGVALL
jgi:hypothetical protein